MDYTIINSQINELIEDIKKPKNILQKAIKDYCSKNQQHVDKMTSLIFDYIKDDIKELRQYKQKIHSEDFFIIIFPALNVYADDIAPEYTVMPTLTFHVFGYKSRNGNMSWENGNDILNDDICKKLHHLENVQITYKKPAIRYINIINNLVKKEKLIERFIPESNLTIENNH